MQHFKGGCNCGGVRYDFHAEPLMTGVCHCDNCQRQTGTSFSIIVGVAEGDAVFTSKDTLKCYKDSGTSGGAVDRYFCGDCGSPIYTLADHGAGVLFIKAGTLDDRSWLQPEAHYWTDTAQAWVDIPGEMVTFPANPG